MDVATGHIYTIGDHVIGCGDSTDSTFVKTVIGNHTIDSVLSDPPYGVAYVQNKQGLAPLGVKSNKVIHNDHLQSDGQYRTFTKNWITPIIPHFSNYNTIYIFNSDLMWIPLRQGMDDAGIRYSQLLIWLKNQAVMSRKDYISQYEMIAYGWYGKHKTYRGTQKNVLFYPRPQKSPLHPTQKPIGLLRTLLGNGTKRGMIVYDGFLGSGSTAVACQHMGRVCIGIEQDPEYVEIALKRLEALTKSKRVRVV